jgi:toxin-antitoxin system PIN domain toxin
MSSLNFLDVNVWLALSWRRHAHAERARTWFQRAESEQFFFCRFTQLTYLRLLTTQAILGEDTHTMSSAWNMLEQIQLDERVSFLAEPNGLDREFRRRSNLASRSPKVWADAYLLAFAAAGGLKLVTFDRALKTKGPESHKVDVLVL